MNQQIKRIRRARVPIHRGATAVIWGGLGIVMTLLAVAVLLNWYQHLPHLEDVRWRIALTALGLAVGAYVCQPMVISARRLPRVIPITGLIALAVSQVCFYALVWGPWKASAGLWRVWWVSLVLTVCVAHIGWVRLLIGRLHRARWALILARIAWTCTAIALPLWIGLALGKTPLPDTSAAYQIALLAPVVVGVSVTLILLIPAMLRRLGEATNLQRGVWAGVAVACSVAIGFYAGRITAPLPASIEGMPSGLAHLSPHELDAQLATDFKRLKAAVMGLDELRAKSLKAREDLHAVMTKENRQVYRPAEEDQIRAMFMSYLAYRSALLRLAANYSQFQSIPVMDQRARAFMIGYTAGVTVLDASMNLVIDYRRDPLARRKLNEPDDTCGIAAGTFDQIYAAVTSEANLNRLSELAAYYRSQHGHWATSESMEKSEFWWMSERIYLGLMRYSGARIDVNSARLEQLYDRVKRDIYGPMYNTQSIVSTLIGDTRMVAREPFIKPEQARQAQPQMRPGDILLERRNWFMSNAFLPGFWPHAAIYVGTIEDLEKLGVVKRQGSGWTSDHPAVRDHLAEFLKPAEDGEPCTILESVSEGVIPNSLTHSMHADYVAVLRPRKLTDTDRAAAVVKAFSHVGKPYDFEFDFFSADKLVCTELVYRSYDGMIRFDLVPIMGRSTLPALEIAKKFAAERTNDDRDLDFVLFLDALPRENSAKFGTAEEFCQTIHRPRGFNE